VPTGIQIGHGVRPIATQKIFTQGAFQERGDPVLLPEVVSIGGLVRALNAVGVTPRDLIAILQAIRTAGALEAELEII
jgi:flagellar P-ring protein precursor FlgI